MGRKLLMKATVDGGPTLPDLRSIGQRIQTATTVHQQVNKKQQPGENVLSFNPFWPEWTNSFSPNWSNLILHLLYLHGNNWTQMDP